MNAGKQPILVLNQNCSCTVTHVTDQLNAAGYSVVRSFDLFSALARSSKCICKIVFLLVYGQDGPPSTLILDGNDLSTSVFLENDAERSSRTRFIALLSHPPTLDQPLEGHSSEELDIGNDSTILPHDKCSQIR
jgi:hypothetical protein